MIQARNIHKSYGDLKVLDGVDMHIKEGEIVSIVGPSGAGKTTLLQILGTLEKPDKHDGSSLKIAGRELLGMKGKELNTFRNLNIGFVFQFHQLLPEFTAIENVMIPALIAKRKKSDARNRAGELLRYLGLQDRFDHKPEAMSGGEQQRVAVARALMNDPKVIFADEPTGNLDTGTAESLHALFLELRKTMKQTFVIVTHNRELAELADRQLNMKDGKFVADGSQGA